MNRRGSGCEAHGKFNVVTQQHSSIRCLWPVVLVRHEYDRHGPNPCWLGDSSTISCRCFDFRSEGGKLHVDEHHRHGAKEAEGNSERTSRHQAAFGNGTEPKPDLPRSLAKHPSGDGGYGGVRAIPPRGCGTGAGRVRDDGFCAECPPPARNWDLGTNNPEP